MEREGERDFTCLFRTGKGECNLSHSENLFSRNLARGIQKGGASQRKRSRKASDYESSIVMVVNFLIRANGPKEAIVQSNCFLVCGVGPKPVLIQ